LLIANADFAAFAAGGLALLLAAAMQRLTGLAASLERVHLLAEQSAAAARGDAEQARHALLSTERALAMRLG
jgi:hypothetical protein